MERKPPVRRPNLAAALQRAEAELEQLRRENEHLLEAHRDLEDQRDFYTGAYLASPIPSLVLDGQGVVRAANDAAAALLDLPRIRPLVVSLRGSIEEAHRPVFARHLERCRSGSGTVASELSLLRGDRPPLPVEIWSGRVDRAVALFPTVIVDLSDRLAAGVERTSLRNAEQAARAESDAKEQFITTLSHELRTPLTPVLAAVSALTAREPPAVPSRQMLEMIERNVQAEARLIDDLLDAARIRRGKLRIEREVTDVHDAVNQALGVLSVPAERKHLLVQVDLAAAEHHVSGDPLRLRQVFWNLLGNSIKFTPAGGGITVRSWDRNGTLNVEVSDTGEGIPAELLERLFRPFEQGPDQAAGLGLGLAIARGVAELHGGSLVAASRGAGAGARFVVALPTVRAPAAAVAARAPSPAPLSHRRILLVEDHADTAASLSELLASEGYQVQTAETAASALAVDLEQVDLVVSDVGLPDRTGHELMRELRQRRRLPAIALSGYGTEADVRASEEAGFNLHLTKPIEWPALLAAIERVASAAPR